MDKKNFAISIFSIIFLAIVIQFVRSEYILKLVKNINVFENIEASEKIELPKEVKNLEKFLILYNSENRGSITTKDNLCRILKNIKKSYEIIDVKSNLKLDNNDYEGIVLAFESLNKITNIEYLLDYVKDGGRLIFMKRAVTDENFYKIEKELGIIKNLGFYEAQGVKMNTNVLLGAEGFASESEFIVNSSLNVELDKECKIDILSSDNIPLLWERNLENGKIIFFNGTMLEEKSNRGLMMGILSLEKDGFIYPIVNSKLLYIDDFPAPIPQGRDTKIYEEFEKDIRSFYWDIWWRDILKYTKIYDYKITGLIIESYNNKVKPPFKIKNNKNRKDFILFSKEILKSGGEIGIHGYNHQSLAKEGYIKQDLGYNPWENKEDMIKSIEEVIRYAKSVLGDYEFRVYVPPSNVLSNEGREAIKVGMKNLKIISSVYNKDLYGDSYVQEFEKSKDEILEMPRFSYGYEYNEEQKWYIYNGITYIGIFSHFIHPDDILDYKRNNNKSWSELRDEFENLLKDVTTKFPWLKSQTVSNSGVKLTNYLECTPYMKYKENSIEIYCENFRPNYYMIIRTDRKIKNHTGMNIKKIFEGVYLIEMRNAKGIMNFESGDK